MNGLTYYNAHAKAVSEHTKATQLDTCVRRLYYANVISEEEFCAAAELVGSRIRKRFRQKCRFQRAFYKALGDTAASEET